MQILAIEHQVPETRLDNETVIDRVETASKKHLSPSELHEVRKHLVRLFRSTGILTRHVTDGVERPIDMQQACSERVLASAGVKPGDLDFIIFGGVTRGFLVPSTASAVQYAIGASGVQCFDVIDACASWARAMQVANSFIASGVGKLGLVVNSEAGAYHECNPWPIPTLDGLELRTSAFTLGEATTATVVGEKTGGFQPEFASLSYGEFGDLAILPIVDSKHHMLHERQPTGRLKFFTRSPELSYAGLRAGLKFWKEMDPLKGRKADAFIPHSGAEPSIGIFLRTTRLRHSHLVTSLRDYGNTISASIPLGLSMATKDGRIKRGDKVFAATVAAGISVVSVFFEY